VRTKLCFKRTAVKELEQNHVIYRHSSLIEPPMLRRIFDFIALVTIMRENNIGSDKVAAADAAIIADGQGAILIRTTRFLNLFGIFGKMKLQPTYT